MDCLGRSRWRPTRGAAHTGEGRLSPPSAAVSAAGATAATAAAIVAGAVSGGAAAAATTATAAATTSADGTACCAAYADRCCPSDLSAAPTAPRASGCAQHGRGARCTTRA